MKDRLRDLLGRTRELEGRLASRIEGVARDLAAPDGARAPLELIHEIVDAVAQEVFPAGRGRQAFPYRLVRVAVVAASARDRAQWQAIEDGPAPLALRLRERLRAEGAAADDVVVRLSFVTQAAPGWRSPTFQIDYTRRASGASAGSAQAAAAEAGIAIVVTEGAAAETAYQFNTTPIAIGRGADVRDARQRLVRTNDVAFAERGGEVNATVSRRHARLDRDGDGAWRVLDEGSTQGTQVVRGGRGIPVPPGTRGLRLQSGDEIVLGRARVRVTIPDVAPG